VDVVSNEKGVSKQIIFDALECALASAIRKRQGSDADVRVSIDRQTGDYVAVRRWQVVEDGVVDFPDYQIDISQAQGKYPTIQRGEFIEEPIEAVDFDRIGAQTAKQVIVQKIREAERAQIVQSYLDRQGELINGVVKRIERGSIIIDVGNNVEAIIPREEMLPREAVRPNDRIRGYLQSVKSEQRGPQLFLSRTAPEFLIALFKLEVPEVGENLIEIMGAARDPGQRSKIAVKTNDSRIDPVGACVGMRGSRVQAITNELAGERIDIIIWDENSAQFVINAMSPAEVVSIVMDEDTHSMDIAVREDQLSLAIGRNGQNVRLASQLTGWTLNVMTESQADEKNEAEVLDLLELFISTLDVDEDIATVLVQEGFSSLEEIAYVPITEMLEIEEFDEDIVKELRARARDTLLTRAIAEEEQIGELKPVADILTVEGVDEELAYSLAKKGIVSRSELAEQSIDDLLELEGMDEARAGKIIMAARSAGFTNST